MALFYKDFTKTLKSTEIDQNRHIPWNWENPRKWGPKSWNRDEIETKIEILNSEDHDPEIWDPEIEYRDERRLRFWILKIEILKPEIEYRDERSWDTEIREEIEMSSSWLSCRFWQTIEILESEMKEVETLKSWEWDRDPEIWRSEKKSRGGDEKIPEKAL